MDPSTPLSLDDMVCFPLYAATRAVTRTYAELLAESGLTYPQYLALLALWESPEPLGVRQLGERLMLDSGTLTPLLKRLEAAGHVVRRRDPLDERRVLVSVTEQGERLRSEVAEVPARLFDAMGLRLDDLVELRERLNVLLGNLADRESGVRTGAPAS
jgi:MarR family transcriptional regulator, organic hydroperoxide resistance regulator